MRRKSIFGVAGLALIVAIVAAIVRFRDIPRLSETTDYLMDTVVTVKVYAPPSAHGQEAIAWAFAEARRVERIMGPYADGTELKKINDAEPGTWHTISPELREVIERVGYFWNITGGAFDPTIAAVKWLWNFDDGGAVPSPDDLAETLRTVGFDKIVLHGDSLSLGSAGTKLDLGGIAKGYIVDRMIAILREAGCTAALVNAGGDISSFGEKPGGESWVIGLRHPRKDETLVLEPMPFQTVATSGDYERYFMVDGKRYHHILDPKTGYPADGCCSVTIWANVGIDADALATGVFVLGPGKGLKLAEDRKDVEALIFYEENGELKHVMTSGVQGETNF